MIRWKGSPTTPNRLWASSQARWPLASGRRVKKSLKMRRWMMMPLTSATSMNMAAMATMYMPIMPALRS
ncbi:hypothetical protein D3C72_2004820 [compost metagenome]